MALRKPQAAQIIKEETDRFMDSAFGGLDLSAFPDLSNPQTESFEAEDKFGLSRVDTSGLGSVNKLRSMLENPPREVLEEIARETRDPDLVDAITDERAGDVASEFVRKNPDYLRDDDNLEAIVDFLARKHLRRSVDDFEDVDAAVRALMALGVWTVDGLSRAYRQLLRQGALRVPANQPRQLTDRERTHCAQLAGSGDVVGAVSTYLRHRVSEEVADQAAYALISPETFISDPGFRPFIEEALLFCWENARADYSPSAERRKFLLRHVGNRFMTIALLDAGWELCKQHETNQARGLVLSSLNEEPATGQNIDSLDDASVEHLYHETLKQYARSARRPAAVYA